MVWAAQGERLALTSRPSVFVPEEAEDPACIPIFWVSKWVDYSDKYGLGRSLPGGRVAQAWPREPLTCFRLAPFLAASSSSAVSSPGLPGPPARFLSSLHCRQGTSCVTTAWGCSSMTRRASSSTTTVPACST